MMKLWSNDMKWHKYPEEKPKHEQLCLCVDKHEFYYVCEYRFDTLTGEEQEYCWDSLDDCYTKNAFVLWISIDEINEEAKK